MHLIFEKSTPHVSSAKLYNDLFLCPLLNANCHTVRDNQKYGYLLLVFLFVML